MKFILTVRYIIQSSKYEGKSDRGPYRINFFAMYELKTEISRSFFGIVIGNHY